MLPTPRELKRLRDAAWALDSAIHFVATGDALFSEDDIREREETLRDAIDQLTWDTHGKRKDEKE